MEDEIEQKETGILKAGMAVVFSHGEYSDYTFGQVYICTQDFNYIEEAKKYYMDAAERHYLAGDRYTYLSSYDLYTEFESYLIRKGMLALCNYREVHTGDYNFFDEYEWKKEFLKSKGVED